MIAKPRDWDTAQAYTGESQTIAPGGHIVKILIMRQETSRNNRPMIVVAFDVEEGGEYDGYYKRKYDADKKRSEAAKWQGVIRYMLYDKSGTDANGFFKGFIGAVEESNPGYIWNWDEKSIAGKKVGMVFGEEEYRGQQDGIIRTTVKAQMARSVDAIRKGVEIPPKKRVADEAQSYQAYDPAAGYTVAEAKLPWEE